MGQPRQTLADLLKAVQNAPDDTLAPGYRKAVASDLIRIGEILGAPLDTIRADRGVLKRKLTALHPNRIAAGSRDGVSRKRVTNLKTSLNRAFKLVGRKPKSHPITEVSPAWRVLWDSLPRPSDGSYLRPRLSRLIRMMDKMALGPATLDSAQANQAAQELLADFEQDPLTKSPAYQVRRSIRAWNEAVQTVKDWPAAPIPELATQQFRIERTAFDARFVEDVERVRSALRKVGGGATTSFVDSLMGADDSRSKPFRPDTIKSTIDTLYNAAITLVENGDVALQDLTSARQIVDPENVALFLERVKQRTGADAEENRKSTLAGYASDLLRAARHGCQLDDASLDRLRRLCRTANRFIPDGMTQKNRDRLKQFKDPEAVLDLEDLEITLINEAEAERIANRGEATESMAFTYMRGLALWLLRVTSYRRRNILRLRDQHIDWPSGKSRVGFLWLAPSDTKTEREMGAELEAPLCRAMRHFWTQFRPAISTSRDNDYLFPGRTATGYVHEDSFATQLSKTVARRTGIEFNFHFGRHLTADILMTADRKNLPVVSESLGHAPGSTTAAQRYTALSQIQAGKTVREIRDARRKAAGRRRSDSQI